MATYNDAKLGELVVDLLEGWKESLLKTGILGGYGLKNLAVNVEDCNNVRNSRGGRQNGG